MSRTKADLEAIQLEGDQIARRLAGMNAFKATEDFKALDPYDAHLFTLQAEIMQTYLHIVVIRRQRMLDAQEPAVLMPKKGIIRPN